MPHAVECGQKFVCLFFKSKGTYILEFVMVEKEEDFCSHPPESPGFYRGLTGFSHLNHPGGLTRVLFLPQGCMRLK